MTAVALLLAALVGLLLGLLGGGGSILTVPIFVYVLDHEPKAAIAQSLLVVGLTSLVGGAGHWRAGNVDLRVAAVFGGVAAVGAWGGARLATLVSGTAQLLLFAVTMLVAAGFMLRGRRPAAGTRGADADAAPPDAPRLRLLPIGLQALGVGVLTGLVGVGGGFLIVPALTLLGGMPIGRAVGTSLVVIAVNGLAGFAGYLGQVRVDWPFVAAFTAVAAAGTLAGARLVRRVPAATLRRGFAGFLIAVAIFILYQNRGAVRAASQPAARAAASVGGIHAAAPLL